MPERSGIAGGRAEFVDVTLLDSGLLTHEEAESLRPRVYEALNVGRPEDDDEGAATRLIKVHGAYLPTPRRADAPGEAQGARAWS